MTFYFCKLKWMIVACAFTCIQCIKKICYFLHDISELLNWSGTSWKWYKFFFFEKQHDWEEYIFKSLTFKAHFFIVDTCWNESACPSRAVVFKLLQHIWGVSFIAHSQLSSWCTVPISWWVNSAVLNKGDIKNVPWMWDERNLGLMAPSAGWSSLMNILFLSL